MTRPRAESGSVPVRVSVQGRPTDGPAWQELARDVEARGFEALLVPDHPGSTVAPLVALAAAAAVTDRIRLGTYVINAGAWDPLPLANEVAALDVMSGGRALLGVGAGHTPTEWTAVGRAFPSARERVDRMIELVDATRALLAGDVVSHEGDAFALVDAVVQPRPVQHPIPLLIGGNGGRVLRYAATTADVVGITGLGDTQPDGHTHVVDWSPAGLERILDLVRGTAERAGRAPELDALVQHVEVTDDAAAAAAALAPHVAGATEDDLLRSPFVWIGTVDEIAAELRAHALDEGITRYTVRADTIGDVARIRSAVATSESGST